MKEKTINEDVPEKKEDNPEKKIKKKKHRCSFCNKKLGLLGFACDCKGVFCPLHHSAHSHNCPLDRKQISKDIIEKKNPKVDHSKLVDVC